MSPEFAQNGPIESEWNCWVEKNTLKMTRNRQNRPKKGRLFFGQNINTGSRHQELTHWNVLTLVSTAPTGL